ncbi:hypothetical protein LZ554_000203 [Drepanopeziza brunnea f. sp. 'monogermtubi']|nr:hypothetical protein LZ554_000203 [Drepanopeziza brunnea f. sp. 'monogermtubi']
MLATLIANPLLLILASVPMSDLIFLSWSRLSTLTTKHANSMTLRIASEHRLLLPGRSVTCQRATIPISMITSLLTRASSCSGPISYKKSLCWMHDSDIAIMPVRRFS